MTDLDLTYSETEEDLRAAVRDAVSDRLPAEDLVALAGDPTRAGRVDTALWRLLGAELGLAGLTVPEAEGGQGATLREAGAAAEELGRGLAPVPFLTTTVADVALLAIPDHGPALLAGRAGVVVPVGLFSDAPGAVRASASGRLTGEVALVPDADGADVLLVAASTEEGARLFRVAADAPGVAVSPAVTLDATRGRADLRFDDVPAEALGGPAEAAAAVTAARRTLSTLLACEHVGIADWCLDTTVRYLSQRRQFGRVVGGFQALKHRLADLWLAVEGARAAARAAADAVTTGAADADVDTAVARIHCGATAVRAAEEALQLHGGIGMTWEHPLHLYLKRAKTDELGWGAPAQHRAALADLADLPE